MAESATLAMSKKAQHLRDKGYRIYDLSVGEPHFPTPIPIQEAAKNAIDSGRYFGYPPTVGYQDLREAIAHKLYRENQLVYQPQQIVVSTGAKQALANLLLSLLNPEDEVIIYSPYWVSYVGLVQLAGGKPVFIQGNQEDNYQPTAAQLAQAITPKTKAILFSSPCNPTGLVFSKEALMEMAAVIRQHAHIVVISDEIYEYINFTDTYTSIGSLPGMEDRVATVNGFSKGFAMTGWRIGYVATPSWLASACARMQSQLTSATCAIAQRAALAALDLDRSMIKEMVIDYQYNRDLAMELLSELPGCKLFKPVGGFYLFPDISAYFGYTDGETTIQDASDFCIYILEKAHVALVAGDRFGDARCVRICYAGHREELQQAIKQMTKVVNQLKPGQTESK